MPDQYVPIDDAVAIPTFIGSVLSFLATLTAILLHIIAPPKRHFRHALILNLLIADCLNSLNNTISGGIYIGSGFTGSPSAPATPSCLANSWIGQFTVQTVDMTILIISITVLSIVLQTKPSQPPSLTSAILICVAAWIPGLITSSVGLGLGVYGQVSGNWCWIKPQYLGLRYGLTHGWRIFVFIACIIIYTFIYIRLKRAFKKVRMSNTNATSSFASRRRPTVVESDNSDSSYILGHQQADLEFQDPARESSTEGLPYPKQAKPGMGQQLEMQRTHTRGHSRNVSMGTTNGGAQSAASPNLKRMLLMNGYPIAYIILWIPGMANRLAESILGQSPRWLQILQASTQFVGLVNALTYGLNEQFRQRAKERWTERWSRKGFMRQA